MKAQPYLRVSTDDKGQDPRRQLAVIEPWAAREGIALLPAVIDEGTSAWKTNPFERPKFVAACERAVEAGASAIVVETVDRFTRQDSDEFAWAKVEVRRRFGLEVYFADVSLSDHGKSAGRIVGAIKAEAANEWIKGHSKKVASGAERAIKADKPYGRPGKSITSEERALVERWLREGYEGRRVGMGKAARLLNAHRGVHLLTDSKERRRRSVSDFILRREFGRPVKQTPRKHQPRGKSVARGEGTARERDVLSSEVADAS